MPPEYPIILPNLSVSTFPNVVDVVNGSTFSEALVIFAVTLGLLTIVALTLGVLVIVALTADPEARETVGVLVIVALTLGVLVIVALTADSEARVTVGVPVKVTPNSPPLALTTGNPTKTPAEVPMREPSLFDRTAPIVVPLSDAVTAPAASETEPP